MSENVTEAFKKADRLFEKGLYKEALKTYEQIAKTAEPPDRTRAKFQIVLCHDRLWQPLKAAQAAFSEELPEDPLWRGRFLLLRIDTAQKAIYSYSSTSSYKSLEDLPEEYNWKEELEHTFEELWSLRHTLIGTSFSAEDARSFQISSEASKKYPSLWDMGVTLWTAYLVTYPKEDPVSSATPFLEDSFSLSYSKDLSPIEKVGVLLEETSKLGGKKRKSLQEHYRIKRLMLPFDYTYLFRSQTIDDPRALVTLKNWMKHFTSRSGKAEAGYSMAQILYRKDALEEVLRICRNVEGWWGAEGAKKCRELRESIEAPYLSLDTHPVQMLPGKVELKVQVKNISQILVHIYPVTVDDFVNFEKQKFKEEKYNEGKEYVQRNWDSLRSLDPSFLKKFSKQKPLHRLPFPISAPSPYRSFTQSISPPSLETGLYVLILKKRASFFQKPLELATFLNVSELFLVGSSGIQGKASDFLYESVQKNPEAKILHFYTLDAQKGETLENIKIEALDSTDWNSVKKQELTTDQHGQAHIISSLNPSYNNRTIDSLAKSQKGIAFFHNPIYFSYRPPPPFQIFIETDRPIYRPTQEVRFKVTVIKRIPSGYGVYDEGTPLEITVSDANGEELFSTSLKLNAMGSTSSHFTIPAGRLLGQYHIVAQLTKVYESGSTYFQVEEYKRPEFEITIDPAKVHWTYDEPQKITGGISFYFGGGVPQAPVTYTITRRNFILEEWLWSRDVREPEEVAQGQVTTDQDGKFFISFIPKSPLSNQASSFMLHVSSRDPGGRTISHSQEFQAAKVPYVVTMSKPQGFYDLNAPIEPLFSLMSLEGEKISGTLPFHLYSIIPNAQSNPLDTFQEPLSLSAFFEKVPNQNEILSGTAAFLEGKDIQLPLKNLKEGFYRLTFTKDQNKWSFILGVLDTRKKEFNLNVPQICLSQFSSYEVGEKAKILLGSDHVKKTLFIEIWQGNFLIETQRVFHGGEHLLELPITEEFRGGVSVRWFGANDGKLYGGVTHLDVPWTNKDLRLELTHQKILEPGQRVSWSLSAADHQKKGIQGEALIRVYDRSLEYYLASKQSWLKELYPIHLKPSSQYFSQFTISRTTLSGGVEDELLESKSEEPVAAIGGSQEAIPIRKDFSETAYFEPHLQIKDGKGEMKFKIPERLTSWKVNSAVVTSDLKWGIYETAVLTQKKLMVRLDIPRFFREDDESEIKVLVHNETPQPQEVSVTLAALEEEKTVHEKLGLQDLQKTVKVSAKGMGALSWKIKVPSHMDTLKIRAMGRSNLLSDAEEHVIPILPSRTRLIETLFTSLDGNQTKDLRLEKLFEADPSRHMEIAQLQIDPQLALPILNSLPFLRLYPFECIEQVMNRTVPLAIVSKLYLKHPELSKALQKIPERESVHPAWDLNDPIRLMKLIETPWKIISDPKKDPWELINLLNPESVEEELSQALSKLKASQLSNGSFPWFPGGKEDLYMTLYILYGFSEAKRFGIDPPKNIIEPALEYVSDHLSKGDRKKSSLMEALFSAYVLTSYPKDFLDGDHRYSISRKLMNDIVEKEKEKLTPYSQAIAAHIYWNLGESKQADLYIQRLLDRSTDDPLKGTYWMPEKESWRWYNDTVESHAFILKTLMRIQSNHPKISGLVQWLLLNRKGNQWKSTKASAAAIYALLDVLHQKGALTQPEKFTIFWPKEGSKDARQKEEIVLGPYDWISHPLRWTKKDQEISSSHGQVQVQKEGPGLAFASLTAIYTTKELSKKESSSGFIFLERKFYRRLKKENKFVLEPLQLGDRVLVGEEIEVRLKIRTDNQFEYVHLLDPRGAGFEAETLLSGWKWEELSRYEEPRDSSTNFFFDWLPQGEYILTHRMRPTTPGTYRILPAVLQSMYAPEFNAYSTGMVLHVDAKK